MPHEGSDGVGGSVLNVIYKLLCLFARQLDVVLLAEIIHSVGDFQTSVSTLLRSEQESQSSVNTMLPPRNAPMRC